MRGRGDAQGLLEARESAYGNNLDLVAKGVGFRKETAALLGYESWAHFVIERRMAGTPEVVTEFLAKIRDLAKDGAAADIETLRLAKQEHLEKRGEVKEGEKVTLEAWDSGFYHNHILKRDYGVDTEAVRAYFPLNHVVATTLDVYQELLQLKFTEIPAGAFSRWHEDVRLFVVHDATKEESGKLVGHFYLDLHPREGKYGHAAIFHILKRNGTQMPCDAMMCNLPAKSKDGTPALLRHSDVVVRTARQQQQHSKQSTQQATHHSSSLQHPQTFFHEFGHIMHGLCSEGDGNSTRLAKCPRDFVEAPSQMLENWCWQASILDRLSKHHETGEPLPSSVREALIKAKNVHESVGMLATDLFGDARFNDSLKVTADVCGGSAGAR